MIGLIDCELKAIARRKTLLSVTAGQRAKKPDLDRVLGLGAPACKGEPGGKQGDAWKRPSRRTFEQSIRSPPRRLLERVGFNVLT